MTRVAAALAVVAWLAILGAMASWSYTDAAVAGAALATVGLGVLVGRFGVVLVPLAIGLVAALATLLAGDDPADGDGSSVSWAVYLVFWALVLAFLVALGVACRQAVRAVWRR